MTPESGILNSWKEIAAYMGRGIRTVQRYEATLHLPVHRIIPGNKRSPVFAYREELDRWMKRQRRQSVAVKGEQRVAKNRNSVSTVRQRTLGPTLRQQQRALRGQFEHTRELRVEFMSTDLDLAMTLVRIAETASDVRKRNRNKANARQALDTILNVYRTTELTEDDRNLLDGRIAQLKAALERLASWATE